MNLHVLVVASTTVIIMLAVFLSCNNDCCHKSSMGCL